MRPGIDTATRAGAAPLDAPRDRPRAILALFQAGFDTLEIAAHLCCGEAEVLATLDLMRREAGRRLSYGGDA